MYPARFQDHLSGPQRPTASSIGWPSTPEKDMDWGPQKWSDQANIVWIQQCTGLLFEKQKDIWEWDEFWPNAKFSKLLGIPICHNCDSKKRAIVDDPHVHIGQVNYWEKPGTRPVSKVPDNTVPVLFMSEVQPGETYGKRDWSGGAQERKGG